MTIAAPSSRPRSPAPAATALATAAAALLSGAPSTAHSLLTRRPLLDTARAAATLVPGRTRRRAARQPLLADLVAGGLAHAAVSVLWGTVLSRTLPAGRRAVWGVAAGAAIHAVDLGLIARLPGLEAMRALPQLPQLGDHLAFGFTFGWALDRLDPEVASRGYATSSRPAG